MFTRRRCVGIALLFAVIGCVAGEPPAVLKAAIAARDRAILRTVRMEYAEQSTKVRPNGERMERPIHYYSWQCAGGDFVLADRGDEEGVVLRDADGRPRTDLTYAGPLQYLAKGDEIWQHSERAPLADIFGRERAESLRLHDLRRLGLDAVDFGYDVDAVRRAHGYPEPEYEESLEDGLRVITARSATGQIRWWIDPERGGGVVRTAVLTPDGIETRSMHLALELVDGVWFPQQVEFVRHTADGTELSTVLTALNTEFNRPEHPQAFSPADIGIEPGTTLSYQTPGNLHDAIWDGEKAVSPIEFGRRVQAGSLTPGATVTAELAGLEPVTDEHARIAQNNEPSNGEAALAATQAGYSDRSGKWYLFQSEWEAYTRGFIMRYRLDAAQARKAWSICRRCEERGRAIIEAKRSDLEAWHRRAEALRSAPQSEQARERAALKQRRAELTAPVDRIFEERLKPELDQLPTETQRAVVEKRQKESTPAAPADAQ